MLARVIVAPIKPVLDKQHVGTGYTAVADDLIKYSVPTTLQNPRSWDHAF